MQLYRLVAIFSMLSFHYYASAQTIVIADIESRDPVPYATIVFPSINKGIYTTKSGNFTVPTEVPKNDPMLVLSFGYEDLHTTVGKSRDTIFVRPKPIPLSELTIRPKPRGPKLLFGFTNKNSGNISMFPTANHDSEGKRIFIPHKFAVYIPNTTRRMCTIYKLLYQYKTANQSISYTVRPQLYEADKNGLPGKPLLKRSSPINLSGEGTIELLCDDDDVLFSKKGVFVGIEVIEAIDSKGRNIISFSNEDDAKSPFLFTSQGKSTQTYFAAMDKYSLGWMSFSEDYKISINVCFSIMLECY